MYMYMYTVHCIRVCTCILYFDIVRVWRSDVILFGGYIAGLTVFCLPSFEWGVHRTTPSCVGTCSMALSTLCGSRAWTQCWMTTRNCVSAEEKSLNWPRYALSVLTILNYTMQHKRRAILLLLTESWEFEVKVHSSVKAFFSSLDMQ